mgnify:CR=1 FL=1
MVNIVSLYTEYEKEEWKVNKAKELLNKLKEFVSLHKVVCLSAAGAVCAVAVTGIVVAVVLVYLSYTSNYLYSFFK